MNQGNREISQLLQNRNTALKPDEKMLSTKDKVIVFVVCVVLLGVGIGIGYGIGESRNTGTPSQTPETQETTSDKVSASILKVPYCPRIDPVIKNDASQKSLFEPLTDAEMKSVHDIMKTNHIVNATIDRRPLITDNYITSMMLYQPKKSEALQHLDHGAKRPDRYAEVFVSRGGHSPPDVMKYKVGPLQMKNMKIFNLTVPGSLHYNTRTRDGIEEGECYKLLERELQKLKPLLEESFDGAYFPESIDWFPNAPAGLKAEERITPFQLSLKVEGLSWFDNLIHNLPVEGTINNNVPHTSLWTVHSLYYLNQGPFETVDHLLSAYENNSISKVVLPTGYRKNLFERTVPRLRPSSARPFSDQAPPTTFEPSGPRYRIDGYTVKWMGWEFTISSGQMRGPSLYNIQFQGERLIYENSLSDIGLLYAGNSRYSGNSVFFDANFGLGIFEDLIPGVDCPPHATYLDTYWWLPHEQRPLKAKGVCVFEADGQESLWRRRGGYAGGMPNHYLIVRFVVTLGNYDYSFDFKFVLDGNMQTKVVSSGYILGDFWDHAGKYVIEGENKHLFGYRVSDYTVGPIHDHTFAFKVDLDVLGTENSFEVIHWKAGDTVAALKTRIPETTKKPTYLTFNQTRYLEFEKVQTEAAYNIDMEKPVFWAVVNDNSKNKWGVKRGYRISHMMTGAQVMPDTHPAMNGQSYTKHHCWITRYHDNEKYVTGSHDQMRMADPLFSMENIVDGEDITNTDIVAWVTNAFLHIPTSESFPQTTREEVGFWLKPFNFFDETNIFDMPQQIYYKDFQDGIPTGKPCVPKKMK